MSKATKNAKAPEVDIIPGDKPVGDLPAQDTSTVMTTADVDEMKKQVGEGVNADIDSAESKETAQAKIKALQALTFTGEQKPDIQKPSIGRIVHYVPHGTDHELFETAPAIITKVLEENDVVALAVFGIHKLVFRQNIPFNENKENEGHWVWPEIKR